MNRFLALVAGTMCAAHLSTPAVSCSLPPHATFFENLRAAKHVFVFRLERASVASPSGHEVRGDIRIVEVLKGGDPPIRTVEFSTDWCGGVRLDVGGYFLAAARDSANTLVIDDVDDNVVDLYLSYGEGPSTGLVAEVKRHLRGGEGSYWLRNKLHELSERMPALGGRRAAVGSSLWRRCGRQRDSRAIVTNLRPRSRRRAGRSSSCAATGVSRTTGC